MNLRKDFFGRNFFLIFAMIFFAVFSAKADEQLLGYTYGAETMPQGTAQIYQWITERQGNIPPGSYNAQDYTTEFEYGLTDRLQGAIYVNGAGRQISGYPQGAADDAAESANVDSFGNNKHYGMKFDGVQASLKYNILSPYKGNGWGLALYAEPGFTTISRISGEKQLGYSMETRIILQKNFMEDRLVWNLNFGNEFEKAKLTETKSAGSLSGNADGVSPSALGKNFDDDEMRFTLSTGLSYLVSPHWYLGGEARAIYECDNTHNISADLMKITPLDRYNNCPEHRIIQVGPSVHYTTHKWWITATWLPQIWGRPATDGNLYLIERQRNEFRLKVAYNF